MGYDVLNRRNIVEEGAGSGSGNDIEPTSDDSDDIANYDFFGPWRLEKRTYRPSLTTPMTTDFAYDDVRRVTQLAHSGTGDGGGAQDMTFNYVYDRENRPLSEEAAHENAGADLYEYDSSYRLEQETREDTGATLPSNNQAGNPSPSSSLTDQSDWRLDGTSNWREVDDENDSTTTRSVNQVNEYTDVDTTVRSHDANGNLTDDGTNSYFYDALNRLVRVEDSGGATIGEYIWDAKGRMVRHIVTDGTHDTDRRLVYGSGVIEEQDASGVAVRQYVYGRGEMVQMQNSSGANKFYFEKIGGSISAVTTDGGFIQAYFDYEAYGGTASVNHVDEDFFNGDDVKEPIDNDDLDLTKHMYNGTRSLPSIDATMKDAQTLVYDKNGRCKQRLKSLRPNMSFYGWAGLIWHPLLQNQNYPVYREQGNIDREAYENWIRSMSDLAAFDPTELEDPDVSVHSGCPEELCPDNPPGQRMTHSQIVDAYVNACERIREVLSRLQQDAHLNLDVEPGNRGDQVRLDRITENIRRYKELLGAMSLTCLRDTTVYCEPLEDAELVARWHRGTWNPYTTLDSDEVCNYSLAVLESRFIHEIAHLDANLPDAEEDPEYPRFPGEGDRYAPGDYGTGFAAHGGDADAGERTKDDIEWLERQLGL